MNVRMCVYACVSKCVLRYVYVCADVHINTACALGVLCSRGPKATANHKQLTSSCGSQARSEAPIQLIFAEAGIAILGIDA